MILLCQIATRERERERERGKMEEEIEEGMVVEDYIQQTETEIEVKQQPKVGELAFEMLRDSKASVEDVVAKMLSIKNESKPKSQLRELVTQMFIHFVTLRQANRSILIEEDRVKSETERAKQPVDFTTLQLHNLMYEKSHYIKAIKACKDFKTKYPDIELIPEQEFFQNAPEDIKSPILSKDPAHDLMLKRLDFELFQRKELCKLGDKLEQHKKVLQDTIVNRKKFLSSLPSHLKSLKKASLPVQNQLGILHSKKLKQHHFAELLPPPLYVVYSQFMAQKEAFGEQIDLEIIGSLKDAQAFAHKKANVDTGTTNLENFRMEDDAPDEEDDGQRRRKRPKRVPLKESIDQSGIYQVHPLKIVLHIYDDEVSNPKNTKVITLRFEYLFKLNVVCVGIEGSHERHENNILCNLFPDDTGLEIPQQSAKLIVGGTPAFDERRAYRPYKWAQHLAGIDFLPELSLLITSRHESPSSDISTSDAVLSGLSVYRQQNRVQTVVQRIRSRKKAQLALVEQLDSLMKLKWPTLSYQSVPWALHTPLCNLLGFSPVGTLPSQTSSLSVVDIEQVQEPTDSGLVGRSSTSKEEAESTREDGELPSLASVVSDVNDTRPAASEGSALDRSRQMALLSKSVISPITKAKAHSSKKYEEDSDLMLDVDGDVDDELARVEPEEDVVTMRQSKVARKPWLDYGAKEFSLVLTRSMGMEKRMLKLDAKIKISMEYPLRPPLFTLSIVTVSGDNYYEDDGCEWFNELRAMEAELNLNILSRIPFEHENYVLAHQVCYLAMLFDYYMDESSSSSEKRKSTSVVDIGLCKPVSGQIVARLYRGRDRRKMLSWKGMECTPGYPS